MEKKPLVMLVKDAREAERRLNEIVEQGGANFDFGIMDENVTTVTRHSDGTTSKENEKHFRITGFVDMVTGPELEELNSCKDELKSLRKEREEMNRDLRVMQKCAFGPLSILLLGVAIITLTLGILTLAKILPLPEEQFALAIIILVVGALALGGSITAFVMRKKKKALLLSKKDEINAKDDDLRQREKDMNNRLPMWYKNALWTSEGNELRNATQKHILRK